MPNRLSLLFVLLLLSGLLFAASGAHGASAAPAASASALEEDFEFELEEEESEREVGAFECEIAHEEVEEGELASDEAEEICAEAAESKKGGSGSTAPEECLLRSAHAHAAVNEKTNKLKLTLGYTAYEPVGAKIKVGNIATLKRRLGRSGVLRIVKDVGEKNLKRLVVRLDVSAVPGYCGKYLVEKVRVR